MIGLAKGARKEVKDCNHLRESPWNVANVKMLPRPIPIANERKTAMKKMMVATECTAMAFCGLKLMQYLAVKLKVSSTRKRRKKRKGK